MRCTGVCILQRDRLHRDLTVLSMRLRHPTSLRRGHHLSPNVLACYLGLLWLNPSPLHHWFNPPSLLYHTLVKLSPQHCHTNIRSQFSRSVLPLALQNLLLRGPIRQSRMPPLLRRSPLPFQPFLTSFPPCQRFSNRHVIQLSKWIGAAMSCTSLTASINLNRSSRPSICPALPRHPWAL